MTGSHLIKMIIYLDYCVKTILALVAIGYSLLKYVQEITCG